MRKAWPLMVLLALTILVFWKVFIKGSVVFPGDMLVGSYFPWAREKWGYIAGVPIKNPLATDVFSQVFIWKKLATDSWRSGNIPLWNPYSYSGYPLLANFQSAAFYPINLAMIIFGVINGWNWLMIFGSLMSMAGMYFLLRVLKLNKPASIVGGICYGLSGFQIVWMLFANASQAMAWIPWMLVIIVKNSSSPRKVHLWYMAALTFMVCTSGHFQVMAYGLGTAAAWWMWTGRRSLYPIIGIILGLMLAAPQLLPTMEMGNLSVRWDEGYIRNYNYGLLPPAQLITLFSPDYFGNATTRNYWGFWNYNEVMAYTGIAGMLGLVFGLFDWTKNKQIRFFTMISLAGLVMGTDNTISKAMYQSNLPGLSTSAAGRAFWVSTLGMSVLSGWFIHRVTQLKWKLKLKRFFGPALLAIALGIFTWWCREIFVDMPLELARATTSLRNLVIPTGLLMGYVFFAMINNKKLSQIGFIILTATDLTWMAWKYLPFVPKEYVYPVTGEIEFLKKQNGIFRVDRERAEIMPPNTWAAYNLSSPSGYDPMASNDYTAGYEKHLNSNKEPKPSRYSELDWYDAQSLGEYNVKYLLALGRDNKGSIPGNNLVYKIVQKDWNVVYKNSPVTILENKKYKERASVEGGNADVTRYTPQRVEINYDSPSDSKLELKDNWYPGWTATLNGNPVDINKTERNFREIEVPAGTGEIVFEYKPNSFYAGLSLSIVAVGLLFIPFYQKKHS